MSARLDLQAGVAGTLAVSAFERLERLLLGREPIFAPNRIVGRLGKRLTGRTPSREVRESAGTLMRWTYGPALGVAYGMARPGLPHGLFLRGALLGGALFVGEVSGMPRIGATPRLRTWSRAELALLAAHSLAFGLVTELAYQRLTSRAPARLKSRPGFYEREPPPLRPGTTEAEVRG